MRVLFVTSTFPRSEKDDQVPWLLELALVLRESGVEVEVLAPTYAGLESHEVFGIPVHRYRYWRTSGEVVTHDAGAMNKMPGRRSLILPAFSLVGAGMVATARLAQRRRFDVIHSHWPLPMGLPARAGALASWSRSKGSPALVGTFHGAELALAKRKSHYRPVLRWLSRSLDAAISNSKSTARTLEELTGVRAEVIPFGPPRGALELRPERVKPEGLPVVLAVGRIIDRKGFPILAKAARRLRGEARVVIAGDGEARAALEREICSSGVEDVVTLAGRVSNEELARLYAGCSVFCLPAVYDSRGETEGLGVVLIEAMSHAKPVVASDVGGIPDAVEDGVTGILVPPNDPYSVADALLRVVRDPALVTRLGEAGRERAERVFSWESVARRHVEIYEAAVGKRRP